MLPHLAGGHFPLSLSLLRSGPARCTSSRNEARGPRLGSSCSSNNAPPIAPAGAAVIPSLPQPVARPLFRQCLREGKQLASSVLLLSWSPPHCLSRVEISTLMPSPPPPHRWSFSERSRMALPLFLTHPNPRHDVFVLFNPPSTVCNCFPHSYLTIISRGIV